MLWFVLMKFPLNEVIIVAVRNEKVGHIDFIPAAIFRMRRYTAVNMNCQLTKTPYWQAGSWRKKPPSSQSIELLPLKSLSSSKGISKPAPKNQTKMCFFGVAEWQIVELESLSVQEKWNTRAIQDNTVSAHPVKITLLGSNYSVLYNILVIEG